MICCPCKEGVFGKVDAVTVTETRKTATLDEVKGELHRIKSVLPPRGLAA